MPIEIRVAGVDLRWVLVVVTRAVPAGHLRARSTASPDACTTAAARSESRTIEDCEPLPLTLDDLAAMAGVSRPTANRVPRHLKDDGFPRLGRRNITIADLESLARAAR